MRHLGVKEVQAGPGVPRKAMLVTPRLCSRADICSTKISNFFEPMFKNWEILHEMSRFPDLLKTQKIRQCWAPHSWAHLSLAAATARQFRSTQTPPLPVVPFPHFVVGCRSPYTVSTRGREIVLLGSIAIEIGKRKKFQERKESLFLLGTKNILVCLSYR